MAVNADRKERLISMRLPEADIAIIDRAAGLCGRSRTDFVREAAVCAAAEAVLMGDHPIRMSVDGFAEFMAVLSTPAAAVREVVELVKRAAPWEPDYSSKN